MRHYYACTYSAKPFSSFLWYDSLQWQEMTNQSSVQQHHRLSRMLYLCINTSLGPFHPKLQAGSC